MSRPFRLLDLPVLGKDRVMRFFTIEEIFIFAALTKETKKTVRASIKKDECKLEVFYDTFNFTLTFSSARKAKKLDLWFRSDLERNRNEACPELSIGDLKVPARLNYNLEQSNFGTYWPTRRTAIMAYLKHFNDVFKIKSINIWLREVDEDIVDDFIAGSQEFGIKWKDVAAGYTGNENCYRAVLDQAFPTATDIRMANGPPHNFIYQIGDTSQLKYVSIVEADWITIENLMVLMNVETVIVSAQTFTNEFVNEFLQNWIKDEYAAKNIEITLVNEFEDEDDNLFDEDDELVDEDDEFAPLLNYNMNQITEGLGARVEHFDGYAQLFGFNGKIAKITIEAPHRFKMEIN